MRLSWDQTQKGSIHPSSSSRGMHHHASILARLDRCPSLEMGQRKRGALFLALGLGQHALDFIRSSTDPSTNHHIHTHPHPRQVEKTSAPPIYIGASADRCVLTVCRRRRRGQSHPHTLNVLVRLPATDRMSTTTTPRAEAEGETQPPQEAPPPPPQRTFYRRPLPPDLIAFSSPEGRQLFREALGEGGMEGFFTLSEQFQHQSDPAFCGLGSLSMALNALGIDPGRKWKGPWRWFDESLLDCCEPLPIVQQQGIPLRKLHCLARCNGAQSRIAYGDAVSLEAFREVKLCVYMCVVVYVYNILLPRPHTHSLHPYARTHHQDVIRVTHAPSSSDGDGDGGPEILLAGYSRKTLGQTGDGHFSPVGGFHRGRDLVLLMDVARFKCMMYIRAAAFSSWLGVAIAATRPVFLCWWPVPCAISPLPPPSDRRTNTRRPAALGAARAALGSPPAPRSGHRQAPRLPPPDKAHVRN